MHLSLRKTAVRPPSLKCERTDSAWAGLISSSQPLWAGTAPSNTPPAPIWTLPLHEPWQELTSCGKEVLRKAHGAPQPQTHLPSAWPTPAASQPHCALPFLQPCLTLHFPKLEARLIPPDAPKRVSSPSGSQHAGRPPREYSIISLLVWI